MKPHQHPCELQEEAITCCGTTNQATAGISMGGLVFVLDVRQLVSEMHEHLSGSFFKGWAALNRNIEVLRCCSRPQQSRLSGSHIPDRAIA